MAMHLAPYHGGMRVGQGFNSFTQEICIDDAVVYNNSRPGGDHFGDKDVKPLDLSQTVSYSSRFVKRVSDVTDAMGVSGPQAIKAGSAGGFSSGKAFDAEKFKEADLNFYIQVKVINSVVQEVDVLHFLSLENTDLSTPEKFTEIFGDTFISGFVEGGELNVVVCVKVHDEDNIPLVRQHMEETLTSPHPSLSEARAVGGLDLGRDTDCAMFVSWSGGGDIKPQDKPWSIYLLPQVAAQYPKMVLQRPQRVYAILSSYLALREFRLALPGLRPLDYDGTAVYADRLLEAFTDFQTILKRLHAMAQDVKENEISLKAVTLPNELYSLHNSSDIAKSEAPTGASDNLRMIPYQPNLLGLQQARNDCRLQMSKIIDLVELIKKNPAKVAEVSQRLVYTPPDVLSQLIPETIEVVKPKAAKSETTKRPIERPAAKPESEKPPLKPEAEQPETTKPRNTKPKFVAPHHTPEVPEQEPRRQEHFPERPRYRPDETRRPEYEYGHFHEPVYWLPAPRGYVFAKDDESRSYKEDPVINGSHRHFGASQGDETLNGGPGLNGYSPSPSRTRYRSPPNSKTDARQPPSPPVGGDKTMRPAPQTTKDNELPAHSKPSPAETSKPANPSQSQNAPVHSREENGHHASPHTRLRDHSFTAPGAPPNGKKDAEKPNNISGSEAAQPARGNKGEGKSVPSNTAPKPTEEAAEPAKEVSRPAKEMPKPTSDMSERKDETPQVSKPVPAPSASEPDFARENVKKPAQDHHPNGKPAAISTGQPQPSPKGHAGMLKPAEPADRPTAPAAHRHDGQANGHTSGHAHSHSREHSPERSGPQVEPPHPCSSPALSEPQPTCISEGSLYKGPRLLFPTAASSAKRLAADKSDTFAMSYFCGEWPPAATNGGYDSHDYGHGHGHARRRAIFFNDLDTLSPASSIRRIDVWWTAGSIVGLRVTYTSGAVVQRGDERGQTAHMACAADERIVQAKIFSARVAAGAGRTIACLRLITSKAETYDFWNPYEEYREVKTFWDSAPAKGYSLKGFYGEYDAAFERLGLVWGRDW